MPGWGSRPVLPNFSLVLRNYIATDSLLCSFICGGGHNSKLALLLDLLSYFSQLTASQSPWYMTKTLVLILMNVFWLSSSPPPPPGPSIHHSLAWSFICLPRELFLNLSEVHYVVNLFLAPSRLITLFRGTVPSPTSWTPF